MKSIRHRLITTYVIVILITTFFFNVSIIVFLRQYYISNIKETMMNQLQISAQMMESYMNSQNELVDLSDFLKRVQTLTAAQIQIIDKEGRLLGDTSGFFAEGETLLAPDIEKAISGTPETWMGKDNYAGEAVIAVSYPVTQADSIFGVIRAVSSQKGVDTLISRVSVILLIITAAITAACIVVSYILSSGIIRPITEITRVAEKMAQGDLDIRAQRTTRDEIGLLSDTLNHMALELSNHEKLKDEFIASVSHELRTPLTSIKGWAVTLQSMNGDNPPEVTEGLTIIEKESDRLTELVEELLDFSRFAAGNITLNRKPLQLYALLEYIRVQMTPKAERMGIRIHLDCAEDLPLVYADENRMKQVLINLVDNAIRYSPADSTISIQAKAGDADVVIQISDEGCGMDEEEMTKATQRFYKGKTSSGNGLGLAICDEIVRMHGGKLTIESELTKGTTVSVILPVVTIS